MADALMARQGLRCLHPSFMSFGILLAMTSFAQAQVLVINPEGATEVVSGPVVTTASGRISLDQQVSAPVEGRSPDRIQVAQAIRETSDSLQISDRLIEAVAWQESRLNQGAVSPKGARGVMQLMPGTASQLGVQSADLKDNIRGGAVYLKQLLGRFDNDLVLTLAAYNAGPGAVQKYGGVPPYRETKAYVAAILARLAASEASTVIARNRP